MIIHFIFKWTENRKKMCLQIIEAGKKLFSDRKNYFKVQQIHL